MTEEKIRIQNTKKLRSLSCSWEIGEMSTHEAQSKGVIPPLSINIERLVVANPTCTSSSYRHWRPSRILIYILFPFYGHQQQKS